MSQIKLISPSQLGEMQVFCENFELLHDEWQILGYHSESDDCIAFSVIEASECANLDLAWLNFVCVNPLFRGQGLATKLIKSACDLAKANGYLGIRSIIKGVFGIDAYGKIYIPDPQLVRNEFGQGGIDCLKAHLKVLPLSLSKFDFIEEKNGLISLVGTMYFENKNVPKNCETVTNLEEISQLFLN